MKKIKLLTIITLLTSLLSSNIIYAEKTVYSDGPLLYIIEDNGDITIIEYFGDESSVVVPMAIGEHFVTQIADKAFTGSEVKSVQLPDTITKIGSKAFDDISKVNITYVDKDSQQVIKDNPISKEEEPKQEEMIPVHDPKKEDVVNTTTDIQFEEIDVESDEFFMASEVETFEEAEKEEIEVEQSDSIVEEDNNEDTSINTSSNSQNSIAYVLIGVFVIVIAILIITKKIGF